MYKSMLIMAFALSFTQVAVADNVEVKRSEIFKCIDSKSLTVQEDCVAHTIAKNNTNKDFYSQIADKEYQPSTNAFATITYYPKLNLIEVISLEKSNNTTLIASR